MAGNLKAKVSFLADTKGLLKGIDAVEGKFNKLGRGLEKHSAAFMRAGMALGAAVGGLAVQGVAYGTTIDRMAESTGQAHEAMSRLAYSAELYHGDAQKVEKGTRRLAKAMSDAKDGMATYQRAFDKTGISATDTEGNLRSVNDVLLDLADYMNSGANETEKMAVAQDLLGGRQSELIPWLKQGSAAIREQFGEAEKLGLVLDSKTAKSMEAMGTSVKKLKLAMRGMGVVVATAVLPVVEDLAYKGIAAMMAFQKLDPWVRSAAVSTVGFSAAGLLALPVLAKLARLVGKTRLAIALLADKVAFSAIAGLAGLSAGLAGVGLAMGVATGVIWSTNKAWDAINESIAEHAGLLAEATDAERESINQRIGFLAALRGAFQAVTGVVGLVPPGLSDIAETAEEASTETDELAGFMDKIKAAFDEASVSVTEAKTPFDNFLETIGLGQKPLEDFTVLLERLGFGADIAAEAIATTAEPLAYTGELITALPDPVVTFGEQWLLAGEMAVGSFLNINESLDAMGENMRATMPRAAKSMVQSFGRVYSELGALDKMTWKTMKKAAAMGLKSMLDMVIDATLGELLAKQIAETAKLGMMAFTNPAALAYIGVVAGIYGAAKAAIGGINSFDESATFVRGGQLTGHMSIGDTIISPEAMKNIMKGDMGGTRVTVEANFYGDYGGGEADARDDIDYLVERIELAMER